MRRPVEALKKILWIVREQQPKTSDRIGWGQDGTEWGRPELNGGEGELCWK